MKTKLLIIAVAVTLVSACTTGTHLAKTYDDDIYFSPADAPPVSMVQNETPVRNNQGRAGNSDVGNKRIVMSQMQKNADGSSTLNNYVYQPEDSTKNSDYQSYNMDRQNLAGSDTTLYYNDDSVKYVINNYYDENDNDLDFSYRINRFHRPYYYDSFFYDDWNYGGYSPYYSGYNSWGYNSWYGGYGGWGYPYSYGYYSPFSFGLGGYWGGGYGGYGYYDGYYGGGYYGGGYYGGGGYYNNHENRDNVRYGRSSDFSNYVVGGNNQRNSNVLKDGSVSRTTGELPGNSSDSRLPNGIYSNSRVQNSNSQIRSVDASGNNLVNKSATIINNRRASGSISGSQVQNNINSRSQIARPGVNTSGNARRSYEPSTTGRTYQQGRAISQGQNYTPSYNKPRIVNQSNYNNNSYTRPRTSESYQNSSVRSANTGGQSYSAPRSSSSMRQTYRSSSSYSSGSSSSSYRSSGYSSPASSGYSRSSSSGSTYSAPPSSNSSSGGGGSYSGGSSGSSSSGSSSGGSSGGRSGSGGRR